jgi:hypothetical protein
MNSDVDIQHFRYRNDVFESDIFVSDIGITDVDVGCRISQTLRSIAMPTYGYHALLDKGTAYEKLSSHRKGCQENPTTILNSGGSRLYNSMLHYCNIWHFLLHLLQKYNLP